MKLGMIGLGRMGSNMVRRLLGSGHECVVFEGVAASVLSAARTQRFASRGEGEFANALLSALRCQFGGHEELH
jgi:6-phosphogluconate dehydrogenase (decarboxylating)